MSQIILNALDAAKFYIPDQGPLEFFVHHNTIHQYEDDEFFEAVRKASLKYKAKGFLNLQQYKKAYKDGRINETDLMESLNCFLKKNNLTETIAKDLFNTLIQPLTQKFDSAFVKNIIQQNQTTQKGYLKTFCAQNFQKDIDAYFSPTFFKFVSSYFDHGTAYWKMEDRYDGIWTCFKDIYTKPFLFESRFHRKLRAALHRFSEMSCDDILQNILQSYALKENEYEDYLFDLLFRFKGWSALVKTLEDHPDWVKEKSVQINFLEYTTVLAVLEYVAYQHVAKKTKPQIPVITQTSPYNLSFLSTVEMAVKNKLNENELTSLLKNLTESHRAEIWHYAYEMNLYRRFLHTYKQGLSVSTPVKTPALYQAFFCIDDREESIRRYLEQVDPRSETFGVAGHFNLAMKFKGVFDRHHRQLCPLSIKPEKFVHEVLVNSKKPVSLSLYGELTWMSAVGSKTFVRGIFQSWFSAFLNMIPFTLAVFSPGLLGSLKRWVVVKFRQNFKTKMLYKKEDNPTGFSFEERVTLAQNLLISSGVKDLAKYVFFIGHGSSSLNNPHLAAYNCGACSGGQGWPNGRIIADILNDPDVRKELNARGTVIPQTTTFIGGYHNTCTDEFTYYDVNLTDEIKDILMQFDKAAKINASERIRRFPETTGESNSLRYVTGRSVDFSIARPEYNHITNALGIVGPRQYTKNLFLDRRAFLISYDPKDDASADVLNQIVQSVGPVCAGINLEYFFSFMDNSVYGSGTKLPHNVTGLVGVMNGYQSDLQLGLYSQMVEIHEPVRILLLVSCSLDNAKKLLDQPSIFTKLVKNRWVELSIHDANAEQVYWYKNHDFETFPEAKPVKTYKQQEIEFYQSSDNLEFGIFQKSGVL